MEERPPGAEDPRELAVDAQGPPLPLRGLMAAVGGSWSTASKEAAATAGRSSVASPSTRRIFGDEKSAADHGLARCISTIAGSSSIVVTSRTDAARDASMAVYL